MPDKLEAVILCFFVCFSFRLRLLQLFKRMLKGCFAAKLQWIVDCENVLSINMMTGT